MRAVWSTVSLLVSFATMTIPLAARANPELPASYDARALGMGGTGTAFLEGAAGGVYFNPALLDGIKKLDASVTVAPFLPKIKAPLAQPGTVAPTKSSETRTTVVPLALLAAGLRVHERVAVGLGVYVASGIGGEYKNVGILNAAATKPTARDQFNDLSLQLAVIESALPIAVRITKNLSFGAAWRAAYVTQSTKVIAPNPAAPGLVNRVEQDLSGYSLLGALIGLRLRVNDALSFALAYRSKMTMDLDGKTDVVANATPPGVPAKLVAGANTSSKWTTPHQLRLGSALSLFHDRLLLALEGRVQMYKSANKDLRSTVDLNGQPLMGVTMTPKLTSVTPLNWTNAYTAQLGAEFRVLESLAVRAGFSVGNSASSAKYPGMFAPPPGILYAGTAGLGGNFGHWETSLAGFYQRGSEKVKASEIASGAGGAPAAPAGTYQGNLIVIAASCGYRM